MAAGRPAATANISHVECTPLLCPTVARGCSIQHSSARRPLPALCGGRCYPFSLAFAFANNTARWSIRVWGEVARCCLGRRYPCTRGARAQGCRRELQRPRPATAPPCLRRRTSIKLLGMTMQPLSICGWLCRAALSCVGALLFGSTLGQRGPVIRCTRGGAGRGLSARPQPALAALRCQPNLLYH